MKMPIKAQAKKLQYETGFLSMEDILMGLRYAYYVNHISAVPDMVYDSWEEVELRTATKTSPLRKPGSDNKEDYLDRIRALGMYFTFLTVKPRPKDDEEPEIEIIKPKKKLRLLRK